MQPLEVAVDDVAAGGDGIGHAPDGRVVFVHGAIPGDRVEVAITEDRPKMLKGAVARLVHASADRVDPPCPHVSDGCGGCGWQHVRPEAQVRLKIRVAEESLRRIGRIESAVTPGPSLPTAGHRTSVRCLVERGRAAYRAERSHDPVVVDHCLIAHPGLDELISTVDFGAANEITLRIGARTGERLAIVDPSIDPSIRLPDDVRVVGADDLRTGGQASFTDRVRERTFRISAESFFQTRTDGAEALVDAVERAGDGWWGSGRLIDLYGGVGLFSACLGDGMGVTLVEGSRAAVADATHNLADLDASAVRVSADRWRPTPADVVIADPPRAGLGRAVVERVVATGAGRIVLVSCDAASFGRDAALLGESGYELVTTTAIDLFPHTPHVELVSRFDRITA